MCKNVGTVDRIMRIVGALVIGVLMYTGIIAGLWAIIFGVVAVIWVLTAVFSFCPAYLPFKICTIKGCACDK